MVKNKVNKLLCIGLLTLSMIIPCSPISLNNPNSLLVQTVEAATNSKSYDITLNNELSGVKLNFSNGRIANITKISNTKYKINNINSGKTDITFKIGDKTYKTNANITLKDSGYATIVFEAKKSMNLSSSDSSVMSVQVTKTTNSTKTFKITTKKKGTTNLNIKMDGMSSSCKIKIY